MNNREKSSVFDAEPFIKIFDSFSKTPLRETKSKPSTPDFFEKDEKTEENANFWPKDDNYLQSIIVKDENKKLYKNILENIFPFNMSFNQCENYIAVFAPFIFFPPSLVQNSIVKEYNGKGLIRFHVISRKDVQKQLEFYFSEENLRKDTFLKSNTDRNGFICLETVLHFPRIKYNLVTKDFLFECAVNSNDIEIYGNYIRSKNHWWKYKTNPLSSKPDSCPAYCIPIDLLSKYFMGELLITKINSSSTLVEMQAGERENDHRTCNFGKFLTDNKIGYNELSTDHSFYKPGSEKKASKLHLYEIPT